MGGALSRSLIKFSSGTACPNALPVGWSLFLITLCYSTLKMIVIVYVNLLCKCWLLNVCLRKIAFHFCVTKLGWVDSELQTGGESILSYKLGMSRFWVTNLVWVDLGGNCYRLAFPLLGTLLLFGSSQPFSGKPRSSALGAGALPEYVKILQALTL